MPLPSWGQSSYGVLHGILCGLKFSEGDPVLRMVGCEREGRNGCCFSLGFGIMVSKVTVKQDHEYGGREAGVITGERFPGGREAGVITGERFPCRRNAVQRPCGRCVEGRLEDRGVSLRGKEEEKRPEARREQ